jgi:hypothetical protein
MKKLLGIILFFVWSIESTSQSYVPPSADAMGLAKFASIPVSYYTGAAGISIPLTQIGGKELSVPVSLSYNSSGIKVGDIASSVGLGWNLNAGGMITRVVRGEADDLANGFCTSNFSDKEPDLFFYNFLGQSGKFVLDKYGNAVTIPFRNIVIRPGICKYGATGMWEIVDENGVSYKFGETTSARETTTVTPLTGASKSFVSSWMLTEIKSPNQTEKIQFFYTPGYSTTKNYFFTKTQDPCHNDVIVDLTSTIGTSTRYINYITAPLGTIFFNYGSDRKDLPSALYLTSILLMDNGNQQVSKFKFQYNYFQSDGCTTDDCYRLKLEKIYDLAPDPAYNFTYNTTVNLPSRYSKSFDHWGYYNSNTVNSWFPELSKEFETSYTLGGGANDFYLSGSSRQPDENKMKANILTNIYERSGASKQFDYEAHRAGNTSILNEIVGGIRIKSITVSDGLAQTFTRSFKYLSEGNENLSSGYLFRKPKYMIGLHNSSNDLYRYLIFSHSHNEIFDLNGVYIGYTRVEDGVSATGKTVYYFSNFDSPAYADAKDPNTGFVSDFSWKRGNLLFSKVFAENGNLLSTQSFEYDFNLTNRASLNWEHDIYWSWSCSASTYNPSPYRYAYTTISRPVILKKQTTETYEPSNSGKKLVTVSEVNYDPITYQPIETTQYDLNRPAQKYIQRNKFVTHHDYYDLIAGDCNEQYNACIATCASEPDPQVKEYCYNACSSNAGNCSASPPNGDPASVAIFQLSNTHQINVPVESQTLYQDGSAVKVLTSSVNIFNVSGTQVHLKEVWNYNAPTDESSFTSTKILGDGTFVKMNDPKMRKIQTFGSYDATSGNLLQQTSFSGIQTNYTWDATNNFVLSTSTTGGVNVRTASSTVKPLVGVLTSTDANGRVSQQEYDVYNRPSVTKDHDGNIIGRTRYHYRGETPGFLIVPSKTEGIIGETFSFSATDVAASVGGAPQFVWDFGDGTVVDNNSTYVQHAYSNAGTFTIKLVGLNPEYGPTTRSTQVIVNQAVSASICENGPISINDCTHLGSYGSCTSPDRQNISSPVILTANPVNGCSSSYSYHWQFKSSTATQWSELGSTQSVQMGIPSVQGSYTVKCTITDGCGNVTIPTSILDRYNNNGICGGGGPQN